MNNTTVSQVLALPCPAFLNVPRNRPVWLIANVIVTEDCYTEVERFEGYAEWNAKNEVWLGRDGLVIESAYGHEVHVLAWEEVDVVARRAPEEETDTHATIYHWDSEARRAKNDAGYFALVDVVHFPTWVRLRDECRGPFARRSDAVVALVEMLNPSLTAVDTPIHGFGEVRKECATCAYYDDKHDGNFGWCAKWNCPFEKRHSCRFWERAGVPGVEHLPDSELAPGGEEPDENAAAGIAWWNRLTPSQRVQALMKAETEGNKYPSIADAWSIFRKDREAR